MVEEMMLLANVTVAEHTLSHFPSCALLRRHAVPPPRQFEPLLRAAAAAGFSIDTATSKVPLPTAGLLQTWLACLGNWMARQIILSAAGVRPAPAVTDCLVRKLCLWPSMSTGSPLWSAEAGWLACAGPGRVPE
jgi:hypothetical protein